MAQSRLPQPPDVIEAGQVLAELTDWRAMMFVLILVIVFLLFFIIYREWVMSRERAAMRDLANSFASSASEVSHSLSDLATKIAVLAALTARAESSIARASKDEDN